MKIEQRIFDSKLGWKIRGGDLMGEKAQWVLAFADRHLLETGAGWSELRKIYPGAHETVDSTSGEIMDTEVSEDRFVATAVAFAKTRVTCLSTRVTGTGGSYDAGRELAQKLSGPDLA